MGRHISGVTNGNGVGVGFGAHLGQVDPIVRVGDEVYLLSGLAVKESDAPDVPSGMMMEAFGGWSTIETKEASSSGSRVEEDGAGNWMIVEGGSVSYSRDDALTWASGGSSSGAKDACIVPGGTIYAIGSNKLFRKSTDYGASFAEVEFAAPGGASNYGFTSIAASGAGVVVVGMYVNDYLEIHRSQNGGQSFLKATIPAGLPINTQARRVRTNGRGVWIATTDATDAANRIALVSVDDAKTWTKLKLKEMGGSSPYNVEYDPAAGKFYIFCTNGANAPLYVTEDGISFGSRWNSAWLVGMHNGIGWLATGAAGGYRVVFDERSGFSSQLASNNGLASVGPTALWRGSRGTFVLCGKFYNEAGSMVNGIARTSVRAAGIATNTAGFYMRIK